MRTPILPLVGIALLAAPVLAQTPTPNAATTVGVTLPDVRYATPGSTEMFSSKLKGLNVYNLANESVGEISDVAIGMNNQVDALILSVGGFLGVTERYVAVSPSSVAVRYDHEKASWRATMKATKDELKKAPEFKYPK